MHVFFFNVSGIDFSHPNYNLDATIISRKPGQVPAFLNMFKPFSTLVWACTLGSVLLVSIVHVVLRCVEGSGKVDQEFLLVAKLFLSQSKSLFKVPALLARTTY